MGPETSFGGGNARVGPREFYDSIPSTQDRALELAREGAPEGTRVVARRQVRGRGRLERSWHSPEGGLYCSVVLRRPHEHPGLLPLAIGARLAFALRDEYGLPLALKWPNDILLCEAGRPARKLSWILTDDVGSPTLGRAVVAGIGVNVRLDRNALPVSLGGSVASLDELVSPPPELDRVEAIVVASAFGASEELSRPGGAGPVRELCRRLLYGVGRSVTVDGRPVGTIEGLGEEGELWVATPHDRMAIWAGDVRVMEA
jgi:BirA family transcriptional regulator, biotin operon repressor / biotin---[acetyl-CoA-carboxylase] ligase